MGGVAVVRGRRSVAYLRQVAGAVVSVGAGVVRVRGAVARKGDGQRRQAAARRSPSRDRWRWSAGTGCRRRTCSPAPLSGCARSGSPPRRCGPSARYQPGRTYSAGPAGLFPGNVPSRTPGFNPGQALRLRLVGVCGHHPVAVLLPQLLPGGGVRQGPDDNLLRPARRRQQAPGIVPVAGNAFIGAVRGVGMAVVCQGAYRQALVVTDDDGWRVAVQ